MPCLTMRTKGLRLFKEGLVSHREEYKRLNYKLRQFSMLNCEENMTGRVKGGFAQLCLRL